MGHIPGVRRKPFYARELPLEILLVVSGLVVGLAGAFDAYSSFNDGKKPGWLAFAQMGAAVLLIVAGILRILRARHSDAEKARQEDPGDLSGCIHVLYGLLAKRCSIKKPDGTLRITLYRVVLPKKGGDDPDLLEQVVDYVGGDGGPKGRTFSKKSGVIGRVARTGEPCWAKRNGKSPEACLQELMRDWGFTRAEAKAVSEDRVAWMGVPIYGETETQVAGVLFLDSRREDIFADKNVQKTIVFSAAGIAAYIVARYS